MPFIHINMVKEETITQAQKETLMREITQLTTQVLGKNPATTMIVFNEVDANNWSIGGTTVASIKNKTNNK